MERAAYEAMFRLEDSFWWHVGMRRLLWTLLADIELPHGVPRVLDAGCGTGANLRHFAELGSLTGVDIDSTALAFCRRRDIANLAQASVSDLPFADASFDVVLSLEVLYHAQVGDDTEALKEAWRLLALGGYCVVRLPAYRWLMSSHDAAVHTRHRYTAGELRRAAVAAGFTIERVTYLNAILLPLAVIRRLLARQGDASRSDVRPLWQPLNAVLLRILSLERHFLRRWNLPVGLSVCALLRKPRSAGTQLK